MPLYKSIADKDYPLILKLLFYKFTI
jgi:hypothetical protein